VEPFPSEPEILKDKPFFEKVEEKVEEEDVEEEKFEEEPEEEFEEPIIEKVEQTPVTPPPVETIFKPVKEIIPEMRAVIYPPVEEAIEAGEDKDTVTIAGCKITIEIPPHILEQTRSGSTEQKRKIAGVLAAQTLEKNPQLTASPTVDPVSVWSDILNAIMNKL
jgi:hypothetical protein